MKTHCAFDFSPQRPVVRAAFTMPELMIAMAVFGFVIAGVLTANLFGLRIFQITQNKLSASDAARKSLGRVVDDIRNCKTIYVGNVSSNGVFTAVADGVAQSGSGLMIHPTTNSANFIIYFLNLPDKTFR